MVVVGRLELKLEFVHEGGPCGYWRLLPGRWRVVLLDTNSSSTWYHSHMQQSMATHRDKMAGGSATLYLSGFDLSYLPPTGLAAASMLVRAFNVAYVVHTVDFNMADTVDRGFSRQTSTDPHSRMQSRIRS